MDSFFSIKKMPFPTLLFHNFFITLGHGIYTHLKRRRGCFLYFPVSNTSPD